MAALNKKRSFEDFESDLAKTKAALAELRNKSKSQPNLDLLAEEAATIEGGKKHKQVSNYVQASQDPVMFSMHMANTPAADNAMPFLGVVYSVWNVIRMPIKFFTSQNFRFTASNWVKWMGATVGLSFAIALLFCAIVFHPLVAPLALASASVGLGVALFHLGKHLYKRYQLDPVNKEKKLEQLAQELQKIEEQLASSKKLHRDPSNSGLKGIETIALQRQLDEKKAEIIQLKKREERMHGPGHIEFFFTKVQTAAKNVFFMDKVVAVSLAFLSVIGSGLALSNPIGLTILLVAGALGASYATYRLVSSLWEWGRKKFAANNTVPAVNNKAPEAASNTEKKALKKRANMDNAVVKSVFPIAPKKETPVFSPAPSSEKEGEGEGEGWGKRNTC